LTSTNQTSPLTRQGHLRSLRHRQFVTLFPAKPGGLFGKWLFLRSFGIFQCRRGPGSQLQPCGRRWRNMPRIRDSPLSDRRPSCIHTPCSYCLHSSNANPHLLTGHSDPLTTDAVAGRGATPPFASSCSTVHIVAALSCTILQRSMLRGLEDWHDAPDRLETR
jgi:hypothetical protein